VSIYFKTNLINNPKIIIDYEHSTNEDVVAAINDANLHTDINKFIAFTNLPSAEGTDVAEEITSADLIKRFPALQQFNVDQGASLDQVVDNDVFWINPLTRTISKVSVPIRAIFNTYSNFKKGHESMYSGYDNDVAFIKFLLGSTPLLNNISNIPGQVELVHNIDRPFITTVEYYKISAILSTLRDRTASGIKEYLEGYLENNESRNDLKTSVFRSLYYFYFNTSPFSYTTYNSANAVHVVPINLLANARNKYANENISGEIVNALTQFYSKMTINRTQFKDGEIDKKLKKNDNPYEWVLPKEVEATVMSRNVHGKEVAFSAPRISFKNTLSGSGLIVSLRLGYKGNSDVFSIELNYKKDPNNPITVKLANDTKSKLLHGNNIEYLRGFFKAMNMPAKYYNNDRFLQKLIANSRSMELFTSNILAFAAMRDSDINERVQSNVNQAIKNIAEYYSSTTIGTLLQVPVEVVADIHSELWGLLSSTYEINGEGNSVATVTNIDRESRYSELIDRTNNEYYDFNVELKSENKYRGHIVFTDDNPVYGGIIQRFRKDGMSKNGNFFSNESMNEHQRTVLAIEGLFLDSLADKSEGRVQSFMTQTSVQADRTNINGYEIALNLNVYDNKTDAMAILKQQYINFYRGKYANLQKLVVKQWTKFLLSSELRRAVDNDENKLVIARSIAKRMSHMTEADFRNKNVVGELAQDIKSLEIDHYSLSSSKILTRGIHYSKHGSTKTEVTINGKKVMKKISFATPETTGGVLTDFLKSDANAKFFVEKNMKKFKETLNDHDVQYNDFTSTRARYNAKDVFGENTTFDDVIEYYFYITSPANDSMLETLMSSETAFGKNEFVNNISIDGRKLTKESYVEHLAERSDNFIKQAKRVQPLNSVGTRPTIIKDAKHYHNLLPFDDILKDTNRKIQEVLNAPTDIKLETAIANGLLTTIGDIKTVNGKLMIKFAGSVLLLSAEPSTGKLVINDKNNPVYQRYNAEIGSILTRLNNTGLTIPSDTDLTNNEEFIGEESDILPDINETQYITRDIKRKLRNDHGEIGKGLSQTSNNILVDEDFMGEVVNLLGVTGNKNFMNQDPFDGVQLAHPLFFMRLTDGLGGRFSSFSTDGSAVKSIIQDITDTDGLTMQKHSIQNIFSNEILEMSGSPELYNIFKIMNEKIVFEKGFSVHFRDYTTGKQEARFFKTIAEMRKFAETNAIRFGYDTEAKKLGTTGAELMMDYMFNAHSEYDENTVPDKLVMLPIHSTVQSHDILEVSNMQELWEMYGSTFENDSWKNVAKQLEFNPIIRNAYIEKFSFSSIQKIGVRGITDHKIMTNPRFNAADVIVNEVSNKDQMVMLQKNHEWETSDSVDHPARLAITSQFLSAMMFEGRTAGASSNIFASQALITNTRMINIFKDFLTELKDDTELIAMEVRLPDGRYMSEIKTSELDINLINQFQDVLETADPKFKKTLIGKVAIKWLKDSSKLNERSPLVMQVINSLEAGQSFNSSIIRKIGTTAVRSKEHSLINKMYIAGFMAVTQVSDRFMQLHNTPAGRLNRKKAIEYYFSEMDDKHVFEISGKSFMQISNGNRVVLPADKIQVIQIKENGAQMLVNEGQFNKMKRMYKLDADDIKIRFVALSSRNTEIDGFGEPSIFVDNKLKAEITQKFDITNLAQQITGKANLTPEELEDAINYYVTYRSKAKTEMGSSNDLAIASAIYQAQKPDIEGKKSFESDPRYDEISKLGTFKEFKNYLESEDEAGIVIKQLPNGSFSQSTVEDGGVYSPLYSINDDEKIQLQHTGDFVNIKDNPTIKDLIDANAPLNQILTFYSIDDIITSTVLDDKISGDYTDIVSLEIIAPNGKILNTYLSSDVIPDEFNPSNNPDDGKSDRESVARYFQKYLNDKKTAFFKEQFIGEGKNINTKEEPTDADYLIDITSDPNNPIIVPRFQAQLMHEYGKGPDASAYKLYTRKDSDLQWAKHYIIVNGKRVPIASTKEYQEYYLFNNDPELFEQITGINIDEVGKEHIRREDYATEKEYNKAVSEAGVNTVKEYLLAQFRLMTETKEIESDPVEVYAPNFNLTAFMMKEGEQPSDIYGFTDDAKEQKFNALKEFKQRIKDNHALIKIPDMQNVTMKEYDKYVEDILRRLNHETNIYQKKLYREYLRMLSDNRDAYASMDMAIAAEFVKSINEEFTIKYNNFLNDYAYDMATSFMNALLVMPPRIPGQGKQSGYLARVVGFINSNKNALYSPVEAYTVTGKDNDIDTDNVITRAIDENGIEYDYRKYMLTKDGRIPADPYSLAFDYSSIVNKNKVNPVFQAELIAIENELRAEATMFNNLSNIKGTERELTGQQIQEKVDKAISAHVLRFEKSIQNYVIDVMRYIMSHKNNIIESEMPISMDELKKIKKQVTAETVDNLYHKSKHGINSYNPMWMPVLENLFMQGKSAIGPFANGQRTLSALIDVQVNQPDKILKIGRGSTTNFTATDIERNADHLAHIRPDGTLPENVGLAITIGSEIIIRDTFSGFERKDVKNAIATINDPATTELGRQQAWELLSQLLSAATDNAKELILGVIGSNNDTNSLIANMMVMGFTFDQVHKFLTQGALMFIFDELKATRNEGDPKSLQSIVKKYIRMGENVKYKGESYDIAPLKELSDVINASNSLNDFRRVLTLAQDNKIETFDLYKSLNVIFAKGLDVRDIVNGNTSHVENEYGDTSESVINPLYYLHKHQYANALLNSVRLSELMITSISDPDYLLAERIRYKKETEGYNMSEDEYLQTNTFLDEYVIERYFQNKKAYLPLPNNKIMEYNLGSLISREQFLLDIAESLSHIKTIVKDNEFLNKIVPMKDKYSDNINLSISFLKNMTGPEHTAIKMSLDKLINETTNDEDVKKLQRFRDAIFYYSLLTSKGKETEHTMLPLFPDEFEAFVRETTKADIFGEESGLHQMLTTSNNVDIDKMNSEFYKLFVPAAAYKHTLRLSNTAVDPEYADEMNEQAEQINEAKQEAEQSFFEETGKQMRSKGDPLLKRKIKLPNAKRAGRLYTITHPKLNKNMYATVNIGATYGELAIKLFKKASRGNIGFDYNIPTQGTYDTLTGIDDQLAQHIHRAGWNIGLEAVIGIDSDKKSIKGRVLAYLGKGMYLVLDSNNEATEVSDTILEDLNPEHLFFGNDFREASDWYKKRPYIKRSYRQAKVAIDLDIDTDFIYINNNLFKKKKSGGFTQLIRPSDSKAIVKYSLTHHRTNDVINDTYKVIANTDSPGNFLAAAAMLYDEHVNSPVTIDPLGKYAITDFLKDRLSRGNGVIVSVDNDSQLKHVLTSNGHVDNSGNFEVDSINALVNAYSSLVGSQFSKIDIKKSMVNVLQNMNREAILKFTKDKLILDKINDKKTRLFPKSFYLSKDLLLYINKEITEGICKLS